MTFSLLNSVNGYRDFLEPVASSEYGRIGINHRGVENLGGGDGDNCDLSCKKGAIYNLLSDSKLSFRGKFEKLMPDFISKDSPNQIVETGLSLGEGLFKDDIEFGVDGYASINGQPMDEGSIYNLENGASASIDKRGTQTVLTVTTEEGYTINQIAGDRQIEIEVTTGDRGVDNGQMPEGLLGETFDADKDPMYGNRLAHGDVDKYKCSSLTRSVFEEPEITDLIKSSLKNLV